jgi:hypothetical protein
MERERTPHQPQLLTVPARAAKAGSRAAGFSPAGSPSLDRRRQAGLNGIARARAALADAARRAESRSPFKAA